MNVLFISLVDFETLSVKNIYTDLLREFVKNGHNVYAISPVEKRRGKKETSVIRENNCIILKPVIGNIQKTNYIEKGISTITLERIIVKVIKKVFSTVRFDLVIYTTPPITFQKVISFVKKRDGAGTYLLLKDIFPQNAVDLGMLSTTGIKGYIYRFFRRKEKKLYHISDYIGCMSEANKNYILKYNQELDDKKVETCPNSLEPEDIYLNSNFKDQLREKYRLPQNKKLVIYGGNLGKPQGIDFLLECISKCENQLIHFLIVGGGTEFERVAQYAKSNDKKNMTVIKSLPQNEYEQLTRCCDMGLILLDKRFTIPNFPSRLLSYMQAGIPVLAATDTNTDIGQVICQGEFGYWSEHGDVKGFLDNIDKICTSKEYEKMCCCSRNFFLEHYTSEISYNIIIKHFVNSNVRIV